MRRLPERWTLRDWAAVIGMVSGSIAIAHGIVEVRRAVQSYVQGVAIVVAADVARQSIHDSLRVHRNERHRRR